MPMKKCDAPENLRKDRLTLEERESRLKEARDAELANPSVQTSLPALKIAAENSFHELDVKLSALTKQHQLVIELQSQLQFLNDQITEFNRDRETEPAKLGQKIFEAREAARSIANRLQAARDLESDLLSSDSIEKLRVALAHWQSGLRQAISACVRDELTRKRRAKPVEMTEKMLAGSVAKDSRVTELDRQLTSNRNAGASYQRIAGAATFLQAEFIFLQAKHRKISGLVGESFIAKFCSWDW
jgi:hypothetical protein